MVTDNSYKIKDKTKVRNILVVKHLYLTALSNRVKVSVSALLEYLTVLLEYLDLLRCPWFLLGHDMHLSAYNSNNSPHKL